MNHSNYNRKASSSIAGFSLLEMIVYIGILSLMLMVITGTVTSIAGSHRTIRASRRVENSAILSLERITREVRQADTIDALNSVFNANPGKLVLNGVDANNNPRTVEFYVASSTVFMKENGVDLGPITQPEARVGSLIFRQFSSGGFTGVRVEMAVESGVGTHYRSNDFYSSVTLR